MNVTRRSMCLAAVGLVAAGMLALGAGVAAASTPATTLRSSWNTTTSGYTLTDCTAAKAQGSEGLSVQICFGEMSANARAYVAAVFSVAESPTATSPQTIAAAVRNVEHRHSSSSLNCVNQTIKPGQTLYCMTGGMPTESATGSRLTASGRLANGKTWYSWVSTPATQF